MLEIGIAFDSSGSDKTSYAKPRTNQGLTCNFLDSKITAQIIPLLGWVWSRVYDALKK